MDQYVVWLWAYIPERVRPYLAIVLFVLWVVTKIRSQLKSNQLTILAGAANNLKLSAKLGLRNPGNMYKHITDGVNNFELKQLKHGFSGVNTTKFYRKLLNILF